MVKKTVVHPYHKILLHNKKEWTTDTHNNLYKSPQNDAEWKKANPQKVIYCIIQYSWNDKIIATKNRLVFAQG